MSAPELAKIFGCNVVLLVDQGVEPRQLAAAPGKIRLTSADLAVAALVFAGGGSAGCGLDRAAPTEWQFHPVASGERVLAVAGIARDDGAPPIDRDRLPLLHSLLDQAALAMERARLEGEAPDAAQDRERNRVRSLILSTIGEDLRPGLDAISAAVSELRRRGDNDREALATIGAEAQKLDRYIANLVAVAPAAEEGLLHVGALTIDLFRRTVTRDDPPVHLNPKEYAVLAELAKHPGQVMSNAHLVRTVWGPAQETQIDCLRVAIRALRQKLEREPSQPTLIINEPAVGYRLSA